MHIDLSTEFGQRVMRRLHEEQVIWLVTVAPDGTPQPRPVWFLWEEGTILIYSQPDAHKVRHIRHNPRVALHFNTDAEGGDVIVFIGEARVDDAAPRADHHAAYLAKYAQGVADLGMTPQQMAEEYNVAIRITPTYVRGF